MTVVISLVAVVIFSLCYFLLQWKLLIALSLAIMAAAIAVTLLMVLRPPFRSTKVLSGLVFAVFVAFILLFSIIYQPPLPPPPIVDYEPIVVDCDLAPTSSGPTVVFRYNASVNIPGELQWFESNGKNFSVQNFRPVHPTPGAQRPCSETYLDGTGGRTNKCRINTGSGSFYFKYDIDCKNGTVIDPMIQIPRPSRLMRPAGSLF